MSTTVLAVNRWRHSLKGRRSFDAFKIPQAVIGHCGIADAQKRAVSFTPSGGATFSFRGTISSGCELLLPTKYRGRIRRSEYVDISIDDSATQARANRAAPIDVDESFLEGGATFRTHLAKERSPALVARAKKRRLQSVGVLRCDVCGFSFEAVYGEIGRGYIEAHHQTPIARLVGSTPTRVDDVALVCSNCHRMIHRGNPFTVEELKGKLKVESSQR